MTSVVGVMYEEGDSKQFESLFVFEAVRIMRFYFYFMVHSFVYQDFDFSTGSTYINLTFVLSNWCTYSLLLFFV